jgi:hypothetical protein
MRCSDATTTNTTATTTCYRPRRVPATARETAHYSSDASRPQAIICRLPTPAIGSGSAHASRFASTASSRSSARTRISSPARAASATAATRRAISGKLLALRVGPEHRRAEP